MQVVFLALGATRRRDVCEESADVVRDGGTATIVVDSQRSWSRFPFAEGVQVIQVAELERHHPVGYVDWLVFSKFPLAAFRRVERGPIRQPVQRVRRFYQRRVLRRLGRRLFSAYSWIRGGLRYELLARHVPFGSFDMIVVADPLSMPVAASLHEILARTDERLPIMSFAYERSLNVAARPFEASSVR